MRNTGIFTIARPAGDTTAATPNAATVCALAITCLRCDTQSTVTFANGLQRVPGGTVITCSGCQVRQAISNAGLDDINGVSFLRAHADPRDPPGGVLH